MPPVPVAYSRFLVGLLLLATPSGCAEIKLGPPKTTTRVLGRTTEEVPRNTAYIVVRETEPKLSLSVGRACDQIEIATVRQVTSRERTNAKPSTDWWLGVTGALTAGIGVWTVADAKNVAPNDTTGREYNSLGPGGAEALGYSAIGVGGAMLTVAIVDAIRASGSDTKVGKPTQERTVKRRGVCSGNPAWTNASVSLRSVSLRAAEEFPLGKTNMRGRLTVPIDDVLPDEIYWPPSKEFDIVVDGRPASRIKLESTFARRERSAWQALRKARRVCERGQDWDSCGPVADFVDQFPNGAFTQKAGALLQVARAKLREQERQVEMVRVMTEAYGDLDSRCGLAKFETKDEAFAFCAAHQRFQSDYPWSPKLTEVTADLERAQRRLDYIRKVEAEEIESRRREWEDEQKRQKAAQRKQARDARARDRAKAQRGREQRAQRKAAKERAAAAATAKAAERKRRMCVNECIYDCRDKKDGCEQRCKGACD